MKTIIQFHLLVLLTLGLAACSEVAFEPGDVNAKTGVPTDPMDPTDPPSEKVSETFHFNADETKRKVDVLFIVDNSGSMIEEQEKLGTRLSSFIGHLSEVDWQIGITTTDVTSEHYGIKGSLVTLEGTNKKILTPNVPDYETVFMNSVVRQENLDCQETGVCPSDLEQPLRASIMAMDKRNTDNAGFFRADSDLAIVMLTDEDEKNDGPADATKPQEVYDHFKNIWGSSKKMSVFGIIIEPGDWQCFDKNYYTGGNYGDHIDHLAHITGGVTGSICDTDYSGSLQRIGENVKDMVNYVVLSAEPEETSVEVTLIPNDPNLTWTVTGRKIEFNKAPAEGTQVDVKYIKKN